MTRNRLARAVWMLALTGCSSNATGGPDAATSRGDSGTMADARPAMPDASDTLDGASADSAAPRDARTDVDAGRPARWPAVVNAMITSSGALLALEDVEDPAYEPGKVAFVLHAAERLEAIAPDETPLWSVATDAAEMAGGFDLDRDGWPDVALVRAMPVASCNADVVSDRFLELRAGRTGALLATWLTARDRCWTFPSTAYATPQWSSLGVLFGTGTQFIALQTQYETQGFFVAWDAEAATLSPQHAYVYPSTSQYGSYAAARPNAYGGTPWVDNAHVANGLVVTREGTEQVALFTSARLAVYRAGPYGPMQLAVDRPFVARSDLAGRNYGLVTTDPESPSHLALLAGTDVRTVFVDRIAGARASGPGSDVWGGIERHVTVYDFDTAVLSQRFYSSAHDDADGQQYEGRVVYPANPWVRSGPGAPSRLAYGVFGGGHWRLHVSRPGGHADERVLDDVVLWDIRDLDGDGVDEMVLSPTQSAGDAFLPTWRTRIARWDEATSSLEVISEHDGIPELVASFRRGHTSTSRGRLELAPIVLGDDGSPQLVLVRADGTRSLLPR